MKKKIYIAGKVTGENKEDCTAKFAQAQSSLKSRGFEPINPLEVVGDWKTPWDVAMKLCIAKLLEADAVVLLPDWYRSSGAMTEKDLALKLKIPIFSASFIGYEQLMTYEWNN